MQEVYAFLKKCETYFIATSEGGQPRVRPFGTIDLFDNKLYIQTGKVKNVAQQILSNPKIEICALSGGEWIRVEALAIEDDRIAAKQHMLDAYPSLLDRGYKADDDNMVVFSLKNATATIYSFTQAPKVIEF